MRLRWNARGDIATQIITWMALVLAGLILVTWFIKSGVFSPVKEVDVLDKDLIQLQLILDEACTSFQYQNEYNPFIEEGNLTFTNDQVCITLFPEGDSESSEGKKITRCLTPICNLGLDASYDLSNITKIGIKKDDIFTIIPQ
ncbi:hypothetical protein KY348_01735 [Candidatus Woesearchaeota archaeon]|nr:hypothetical protein [Candidatus Woesearchaeota archaeon]